MILSEPRSIREFTESQLENYVKKISDPCNAAIGEIAGRDSIAAIIKAISANRFSSIIPTVVYTGTEYGNWQTIRDNVRWLRERTKDHLQIHDIIFVGDPVLWSALNGKFSAIIREKYNLCSPCLACHLYMHLCRVPLSLYLGTLPIISGERNAHQGRLKLSQTPEILDAFIKIFEYAKIPFLLPLRDLNDNVQIEYLVGSDWKQGQKQLCCVFSGNYYDANGDVNYDKTLYQRFIDEYIVPCGIAILDEWNASGVDRNPNVSIDYCGIVSKVLQRKTGS